MLETKRDFPTTVRMPKSYKKKIETLANDSNLKPAAWTSKSVMDLVDKQWSKRRAR